MPLKKYIADSKMFEYDKHYRECAQSNHPFIKAKINPINGNYHVQIDLMTCSYNFSKEGKNHLKELFENEKTYAESKKLPNNSFIDYSIDEELSWVDGILPIRLDSFCENLYELSQKYHE